MKPECRSPESTYALRGKTPNAVLPAHRPHRARHHPVPHRPEVDRPWRRPDGVPSDHLRHVAHGVSRRGSVRAGRLTFVRSLRDLNWATYVVGLSIVGVELAILLAYRAGWKISLASVVANVATALLLVIIGVVGYREHLAARHVVGLLMCLGGLVLIARP